MNKKIIFISWTPFGRHTELLGKALGAEIYFIKDFIKTRGLTWYLLFPLDYLIKSLNSVIILLRLHPMVVFVQNPPSIAPVILVLFSKLLKIKTVIDSHNGAFEKPWVNVPFHIWSLRKANVVTIHNQELFNRLISNKKFSGIKFMILNSRMSEFPGISKAYKEDKYFLVISSFSADEPMDILLEGLRIYISDSSSNIKFRITGNYRKKIYLYDKYSEYHNIEFLGFVDDDKYNQLLVNAFGVIALSTRDDVQQFALMEAVGAEVPFISSKNKTNIALFDDKMILTENLPCEIAKSITIFIQKKIELDNRIIEVKNNQKSIWEKDFEKLIGELENS